MQHGIAVISPSEWDTLQQQATALVASGFLPASVNTAQKAVAIMMLGRELGIPPWAALSSINVIQGKPTASPQLMLALINRSGQLADMECIATPTECTVTMVRRGRVPHTETFSFNDAAALNLTGKDNYKKQPATMLKWRAVAACARVVFPDVILGFYTPEEMGAEVKVDDDGNMEVVENGAEKPSTPILVERVDDTRKNAPTPAGGAEKPPLATAQSGSKGSTGTGTQNGDGSSAGAEFFPPPIEGAEVIALDNGKKPRTSAEPVAGRTVEGMPIVGSLNMVDILNIAVKEKLVKGKEHFANQIDLLKRDGSIRDASSKDAVLDAMRKHAAEKDLAKEGAV